jgi:predicted alpha/beta-fold hydrolase
MRRAPNPGTVRERLETPDGDFLHLDRHGPEQAPIVLLLHGLTGSSRSGYVRGMQSALAARGFRSVAMNFRGCSGEPNHTARAYHSGETGDLDHVYRTLRERHPNTPLAAVGYSLGGNVLLKWLGEGRGERELFAAVAVSAPLLLDRCASRMDRGFSRIYRDRLVAELKEYVAWKRDFLLAAGHSGEAEKLRALGDLAEVRSFWDYDDRVVARLYGFRDVHDYYGRSSARQYLKDIRVSTLVIHSRDDPFMTPEVVPSESELSDDVSLEINARGGHVGFIAGAHPGRPRYWLEERIPGFLQQELRRTFPAPATLRNTAR